MNDFFVIQALQFKEKGKQRRWGKKKKKSDAICDQNTYACNWMSIEVARFYINTIL